MTVAAQGLDALVAEALMRDAAVPAITCYTFSTALAVVAAAEDARRGVVLLVAPNAARGQHGMRFIRALRQLADEASVPVVVQLDHATEKDLILAAVDAGAHAVLADGSKLPYDENIAFVAEVAALVRPRGVAVEAELGEIDGDEDRATATAVRVAGLTDPARVADFVARSGADVLAVAVGNVHGRYAGDPFIDWHLVEAIRTESPVPLAMHGASGLPESAFARLGSAGIGKVNLNTELRGAMFDAMVGQVPASREAGDDMLALEGSVHAAAYGFTRDVFERLGS